MVTIVAALA